jgi:hypothetical protein
MPDCCCSFISINQDEQAILTGCTKKDLEQGPNICLIYYPWQSATVYHKQDLKINEWALITDSLNPELNKYVLGPKLIILENPYQQIESRGMCPILDQDDYITVSNKDGIKRNIRGPTVFVPTIGETWTASKNTIQVPINSYLIVTDSNCDLEPIQHIRGPFKFFPDSFQVVVKNGNQDYFPCVEVTKNVGIHLQRATGEVVLLDIPQFYMPLVGEKVVCKVNRTILLNTDFCILTSPTGNISVKNGRNVEDRSFFPEPFCQFVKFSGEKPETKLSTLPTFMAHKFNIRTQDNVVLSLDLRISFQIQDVEAFSTNPIDFFPFMKNHVQNTLLDIYAKSTLRDFMVSFSKIAQASVVECCDYFQTFGIVVLDVQILNYKCTERDTQELLNMDIHTNVNKQNELRAHQNDILIQAQANEVSRKQKDLEIVMAEKDNDVIMQKKILENNIRIKEMEIMISEEEKRTELLSIKRGNDLLEAEFEGKAKGNQFNEFLKGIDKSLSPDQKIQVWGRKCDLDIAKVLYEKCQKISMYPPQADLKMFNFGADAEEQPNYQPFGH